MTCDELEVLLPDGANDPEARAHLAECADCRESAAVLTMAAMPALTVNDKAKLVGLASAAHNQWTSNQQRRSNSQRFLGLAMAASMGAILASGVMWKLNVSAPQPSTQTRMQPEVLVLLEDSSPLTADDESSFEVSWPSLNEDGDVQ